MVRHQNRPYDNRPGKKYMEEGQFGEGTMKPKVEAALNFIGNSAVKSVLITKLGSGADLEDGTVIKK